MSQGPHQPHRILIVRLGSLGDVVHAMPAAAALRAAFPEARLDWVTDPRYLDLLDLLPVLDSRIGIDTRAWGSLIGTIRTLRARHYDAVLDLQGLLKSAVLARAAGARRTIGFPREHLREPVARLFYSEAPQLARATHVIDKNLSLLSTLDVSDRSVRFPLRIPSIPSVDALAHAHEPDGFVLLNPGAAWPNKRWPPERFGALAASIHRLRGVRSVVLWGPTEEALASAVVRASSDAASLAPATTIPALVALCAAARLVVSGDTGPTHIAAAVGTPVVALFGPTRSERNGPWDEHDVVISRAEGCECMYERRCRRSAPCIEEIGVDHVMHAVSQRLAAHA